MMTVGRIAALVVALATLNGWSLTAAQDIGFTCEDFITQTAAQTYLENDPSDPYGLDPDGDGIACEDMQASGDVDAAVAQEADIDCDDFVLPQMAQAELDKDPGDPYGLDPDGNGIACDDGDATQGASETAPDADAVEESRPPLDARLGGTLESWQAEFGPPVEREGEQADLFTEYAIPDLGTVYADDYLGRIESITIFAPRPEGEEWTDDSHEMNWSVEQAHEIAEGFLPRDADLEKLVREEWSDLDHVLCTSDALAAEVPQEIYDYVDNTPQYGRCSYALMHEDGGDGDRISWIIIGLEIEEPLDVNSDGANATTGDEAAIADISQGASESTQLGFNTEERAYLGEMEPILTTVGESLTRFGELSQNPQFFDEDWVVDVALQFVIWRTSYQDVLALQPPPAFADIHSLYVEALRLIDEASYDISVGLDTGDDARLNQALPKMEQANDLIDLASVLLEELVAERGG
jgi:hypothetical protein